jgi:signal transduction histidine kinase/ActR/RegA family two-component response regulator
MFERLIPDPRGGPPRYSQAHYVPEVSDGVVRGFYVLVADITERKRAEDSLLQMEKRLYASERLAAMATLAAGIAHEINNPLSATSANLDLALEQIERTRDDAALRAHLLDARDGAARVAEIVRSMSLLARSDGTQLEPVDVNWVIDQSIRVASNAIRYQAHISRELQEVGCIAGNATQLSQVFVSLLLNAAQAMPSSGAGKNEIRVVSRKLGERVIVEVADNGVGILPELRSRIFDPFFTTKDVGEGLGLGLTVSSTIVQAFGGEITVESEVGRGSVFRVTLPASASARPRAREASAQVRPQPPPSSASTRPHVLIVDDDAAVGTTLQRILQDEYRVDVLNDGREAVARLTGTHDYQAVLCDLMMPGLTGDAVYAEVIAARPELEPRFLFMTGGAFTGPGRRFLERMASRVLEKPFALAHVRSELAALTGRSATSG